MSATLSIPTVPAVLRGPQRADLLREECLADVLAATARRRPGHPALLWQDRVVSYSELDATAARLGAALARRGAGRGGVVGLFLPRGADLLIAQAGITHSGAAWLPFDAEAPLERIKTCLASAEACGLVTTRDWLPRLAGGSVPVWAIEDLLQDSRPGEAPSRARPTDPAYIIYTSGSTGEPKGIAISHRSICHFLRSENEWLGVREADRVYAGFSVAFDMSFEEIWISYLVGATLWIAPAQLVGDPEAVAEALERERITVLHAVPTLMSLLHAPLPGVRLINLGGEACPSALAQRLIRPGRRVFNTYGPTEAAVSASLAELKSNEPVSIGRPLPNYGMLVVDEQRRPLPAGQPGELCLFGPGLAIGYLGKPALTAEKFVSNPVAANADEARMYLTGDLARIEPDGPVHCLGRTDSQVKIRGFRVELDEIAAVLTAQPGVGAAGVVVRQISGLDQIVAFLMPAPHQSIVPAALREAVVARLPQYMVPARFEVLAELPRLTSGKVDAKALGQLPLKPLAVDAMHGAQARDEDEAALFKALATIFPDARIDADADFFDDLGGHSLMAARVVSQLRENPRYVGLGVQDVYRERKLAGIARAMGEQRKRKAGTALPPRAPTPLRRRFCCGLAQAAVLPFLVLLHMADWLAPFFVYHYFTGDEGDSIALAVLYALGTFGLAQLLNLVVAVVGKRWVAGSLKAGRYPLWGTTYFRWWLGGKFCGLPDTYLLAATPWLPMYLRALGARVGRDVMIDTLTMGAPELLVIEDGVSIGTFVNLENARVEAGELILGPVNLERESVVDSYAVLESDTRLGAGARLGGQSALAAGREIPAGEVWDGAPARRSDFRPDLLPPRPHLGFALKWAQAIGLGITAFGVAVLFFLPTFPAFMLIDWMDLHTWDIFETELSPVVAFGFYFLLAIPASALLLVITVALTAALRGVLPRQKAGLFRADSIDFWRKRFMALILDNSLHVLHGLYASVYAPLWLRWLGVKVGRHTEVSTAAGMTPELLTLGEGCFVADGAMLGDEEVRGGWMVLKPTRIGSRSFVGNGAYLADGAVIPDDVLIGVQTRAPRNEVIQPGQTWIGSPPQLLPARERLGGFPDTLTFRPSKWRRLGRGLIEGLRIVLPLALVIATGYLIVVLVMPMTEAAGSGLKVAAALSLAGCLYGVASFLIVVVLKWIVIGRYRPRAAPMWTPFVWLSEAVTNLYESLAVPNFLDLLRGTPMLPWALRGLGVRIGRGVFLNTTDVTEFDCVRIGDEAELNAWCGPQTHLFEDRVMKIGIVEIGPRVTVGPRGTVLYDSIIGAGARLGPLTLVSKGEHLPAGTRWEGTPASSPCAAGPE